MQIEPSSWWRPDRHADRRPYLIARNRIARAMRDWFEDQGFTEVQTATLQVSAGAEAHLHAFQTEMVGPDGARRAAYLRTSPEFACKALLAAGERAIYEFGRVWRNRERGPLHQPEFTMLEWYRAERPYTSLMEDCAALLSLAAETAGVRSLGHLDRRADPFADPERMSVAEAFDRFARIDLLATINRLGETDAEALAQSARAAGVRVAADDSWSDVFSRVLVEIEPRLGLGRATILYDYPAPQAALARIAAHDRRVAERFELYACGVELANAFGELTDAGEQRRRFQAELDLKTSVYGERHLMDEDFLRAVEAMPQASGAALGFERLVMLATGASHIDQVTWSPAPHAALSPTAP